MSTNIVRNSNILIRIGTQPTVEQCLSAVGVAVDVKGTLEVTCYAWVNDLDIDNIRPDMIHYRQ